MRRSSLPGATGFSLVELLVVVSLISLVATVSISILSRDWRRARLNSTALEWAAWLELVRKAAQRTESGCTISISTLSAQPAGTTVAVASNLGSGESACAAEATLHFLPSSPGDRISTSATSSTLIFTPRGTILGSGSSALSSGWEWRFALSSATAIRCIRLSGLLGAMQVGSNESTASVSSTCTDYTAY